MDLGFLWEEDVSEPFDEQGKGDPLRKGEEENLTAVALLVRDLESVGCVEEVDDEDPVVFGRAPPKCLVSDESLGFSAMVMFPTQSNNRFLSIDLL